MSSAPGVATSCCGSCPTRHRGYPVTSRQRGAGACACAVLLQEGKVRGACGTASDPRQEEQSLHRLQQFGLLVCHWETTMGRLSKSLRNEKMQACVKQADKTLLDSPLPGRALTHLLPQPEELAPSPGCSHPPAPAPLGLHACRGARRQRASSCSWQRGLSPVWQGCSTPGRSDPGDCPEHSACGYAGTPLCCPNSACF